MCPFSAGIFLNFLWHRLHSTGFCSGLFALEFVDDVVVVVVTLVCEFVLDALLPFDLFDAFCWDCNKSCSY